MLVFPDGRMDKLLTFTGIPAGFDVIGGIGTDRSGSLPVFLVQLCLRQLTWVVTRIVGPQTDVVRRQGSISRTGFP